MKTGLIVEDLVEAQTWLHAVLCSAFPSIEVVIVGSLKEARSALMVKTPDIALVDIGLPDGNGIDLIRQINDASQSVAPQHAADTLCVVTSVFDDDIHIFSALRAGAAGYLLKDQQKDSLIQMLTGIADGKPPLSPSVARRVIGYFAQAKPAEAKNPADESADKPAHEHTLTARESEVLALIAKGYTAAAVADMLEISVNTVAGYVKSIYRKLNVSSRAEATIEAARLGMIGDLQ